MSSNEIRRLRAALALAPAACGSSAISWSNRRRRRQRQARTCHTDAVVTVRRDDELHLQDQ